MIRRPSLLKSQKVNRRRHAPRRLGIEGLEDRRVFAGLTVTGTSLIVDGDTSSIARLQANPGTDGLISLREAVAAANNTPGADRIDFDAKLNGQRINAQQLTITDDLIIEGQGADQTELNGSSGGKSIFDVKAGAALTLANLTVKQGKAQKGGAITNAGTTTLVDTVLTGNRADDAGGAIHNLRNAQLNVVNSKLENNATLRSTTGFYKGGAIYNAMGTVTIVNSTIRNNASGRGGGVYNESAFSNGSVAQSGVVTVVDSVFDYNRAGDDGGGLFNLGEATIKNSLFTHNAAPNSNGGAIANAYRLTLVNSTLTANRAERAAGLMSGNIVPGMEVQATVQNSTIADNEGHGIYQTTGTVTTSNTIIHGNGGADIRLSSAFGTFRSEGHNLMGTTENPFGGNLLLHASDLRDVKPLLGSLSDNGGATKTMMPLTGSPAINAGDANFNTANLLTDQRGDGFARVLGGRIDIGAVETPAQATPLMRVTLVAVDSQGKTLSQVARGDTFFVRALVEDLQANPQGVFSAYVDLNYDATRVRVDGSPEFPGVYMHAPAFDNETSGVVNEIGAFSIRQTPLGTGQWLLFSAPFQATSAGSIEFRADAGDDLPAHETLLYGRTVRLEEREIQFQPLTLTVVDAQPTTCVSWQNCANSLDVNNDGQITPLDALAVINDLNASGARVLESLQAGDDAPSYYLDVTGDRHLSPGDVLMVINFLNQQSAGGEGEGSLVSEFNDSLPLPALTAAPSNNTADDLSSADAIDIELAPMWNGVASAHAADAGVNETDLALRDWTADGEQSSELAATLEALLADYGVR